MGVSRIRRTRDGGGVISDLYLHPWKIEHEVSLSDALGLGNGNFPFECGLFSTYFGYIIYSIRSISGGTRNILQLYCFHCVHQETLNTGLPLTSATTVGHSQRAQTLNGMLKLHRRQSQEQKPGPVQLVGPLGLSCLPSGVENGGKWV